jgi:hypothetical protein
MKNRLKCIKVKDIRSGWQNAVLRYSFRNCLGPCDPEVFSTIYIVVTLRDTNYV